MLFVALAVYSYMLFVQFVEDLLTLRGLCGPAHHAVRGALVCLGGLLVHALHAVRGGRFDFYWSLLVLLLQSPVHF